MTVSSVRVPKNPEFSSRTNDEAKSNVVLGKLTYNRSLLPQRTTEFPLQLTVRSTLMVDG